MSQKSVIVKILVTNTIKDLNKAMLSISNDSNMILGRNLALAHFKDLQDLIQNISLVNREQAEIVEKAKEDTIHNDFAIAKKEIKTIITKHKPISV